MKNIRDLFMGISSLKDLTTIGASQIIGTGITSIFWFYIASVADPKQYGEIFYFLGIAGLASYFALVGTQNTITVYTAKNIKIQSTLFLLSLIIGSTTAIVIFGIFNRVDVSLLILAYIINILALGEILGRKLYSSYSKYFLIQKIATLILGIGFYFIFGIDGIIPALVLSYSPFLVRIYKVFKDFKINFSLLKPHFGFITNNYFMSIVAGSTGQIDKIIIPPILGFTVLGNYSLAIQIVAVLIIFPSIVFRYTLPHDALGNRNLGLKKLTVFISIGIAISGMMLLPQIIPSVFPKYNQAIDAIQIMSLSVIPYTINQIYTSKFLGMEKSKFVLFSTVISLSSLIIGMIILGKMFDMTGIAFAFLISASASAIFLVYSNRFLKQN